MTNANETVSAVVRACMGLTGDNQDDVARVLGLTRPAVTARLAGRTRWTVIELELLGAHYGVEPAAFLDLSRLGLLVNLPGDERRRPTG
jgi:antitoxin component HigA of HigAB toxin-antitoxin module